MLLYVRQMGNSADVVRPGISRWWGVEIWIFRDLFTNSTMGNTNGDTGPSTELWSIKYMEQWAIPIGMLPSKSLSLEIILLTYATSG